MVEAAMTDWRKADLNDRERALCEFSEKLSREPAKMQKGDVESLRANGLDDGTILEVVHVIGFFNHINRVADALEVELEDWMPPVE